MVKWLERPSSIVKLASSILARGTEIFVAPGEHSFSLFQEDNIAWSICVLLTSPLLKIGVIGTLTETVTYCSCNFQGAL